MLFRRRLADEADAALVSRTAEGDERAFRELLDRHQGAVYRVAFGLLKDTQEAEDIAQEVFLGLYRSAASYRPRASLRTYLFRIARNRCIDSLRKKRPEPMEEPPEPMDVHTALEELTEAESMKRLRDAAEELRDELLLDSHITQVDLSGVRDYEIHIEVPMETLRRYGMTLSDVADKVATSSVELGGGTLKTSAGDILVRVKDRKDYTDEYAALPLLTEDDGSRILLGEVATVTEGFEETDTWASYDGKPAVMVNVYRVGNQTPTDVAGAAKAVLKEFSLRLPEGLHTVIHNDGSKIFAQRAELLITNAYLGLALVFVCLALFLEIRLAFWVSLGIPISFLGSFLFLGSMSFSINMISMFAFIITLGIVVDDAVVVGENVYHYRRQGLPFLQAAIEGAREVAMPVVFSVLTNIVAFMPLWFVPGVMGKIFKTIPLVVLCVFGVSLVESLFVLPAHLSHGQKRKLFWKLNHLERWQAGAESKGTPAPVST